MVRIVVVMGVAGSGKTTVGTVYLKGSAALVRSRLQHRTGHYMKADMLASQFAALEEPSDALIVDISQPPAAIVEQILNESREPTRVEKDDSPNRREAEA